MAIKKVLFCMTPTDVALVDAEALRLRAANPGVKIYFHDALRSLIARASTTTNTVSKRRKTTVNAAATRAA